MKTSHFCFGILICVAILQFCTYATGQHNTEDDIATYFNQIQNQLNSQQAEINLLKSENIELKAEIHRVTDENKRLNTKNQKFQTEIDFLTLENQKMNTKIFGQHSNGASFVARATAQRTYNAGDTILFDGDIENVGDHYDPTSGEYTCPANGYYLFSSTLMAVPDYEIRSAIYVDGSPIVYMMPGGEWDQTSVTAVVSCAAGQVVTVRSTYDNQYARASECSFTGTLLSLSVEPVEDK